MTRKQVAGLRSVVSIETLANMSAALAPAAAANGLFVFVEMTLSIRCFGCSTPRREPFGL